jgi:hypothetical protein
VSEETEFTPLRERLERACEGDPVPLSHPEAAVAHLGYALNVLRPDLDGSRGRFFRQR